MSVLELTPEIMGGLALAVFWIHVLLVAAAAGQELRDLLRLRRSLRPLAAPQPGAAGLLCGTVRAGQGPDGALARNVVEQIGRGKGDGKVHFSDAAHVSEVFGGVVELDGGEHVALADRPTLVWPDLDQRAATARPSSAAQIAEVEGPARRAKGWRREVVVPLVVGQRVWIGGRLVRSDDGLRVEPGDADRVLVSAIDPRAWLARKSALVVGFILATLALAAGCTLVALWPPLWDWISMLGAGAALGLFLGVQPLGVSLAEGVRTPDRAYLRGTWSTPPAQQE